MPPHDSLVTHVTIVPAAAEPAGNPPVTGLLAAPGPGRRTAGSGRQYRPSASGGPCRHVGS